MNGELWATENPFSQSLEHTEVKQRRDWTKKNKSSDMLLYVMQNSTQKDMIEFSCAQPHFNICKETGVQLDKNTIMNMCQNQ